APSSTLPHDRPPIAQQPKPTTDARRSVFPSRRYSIASSLPVRTGPWNSLAGPAARLALVSPIRGELAPLGLPRVQLAFRDVSEPEDVGRVETAEGVARVEDDLRVPRHARVVDRRVVREHHDDVGRGHGRVEGRGREDPVV